MRKQYIHHIMLGGILLGVAGLGTHAWADDTQQLKEQVQALQNRVNQLESQLANAPQARVPAAMPGYDWDDPFVQMMQIRDQMARSMHEVFGGSGIFNPRMDMKQTDNQYIITMDIPGMDKDKINIETKEDMLVISGERHSEIQNNKNNQYYRQERSFGTFMQAIPLPQDARRDRIEAKYDKGVLTVTVPRVKKGEKLPGIEKIKVS